MVILEIGMSFNIVSILFILTLKFWSDSITRFLVEEIEIELDEEDEDDEFDFGLNSFRKGVFRVPLYLVIICINIDERKLHILQKEEKRRD